ncbi:MAG: hypothetical protein HC837_04295 [Chloroflexaceae bacterium]|nr:hypothetical protein [Chloroflexaceae bacterium]
MIGSNQIATDQHGVYTTDTWSPSDVLRVTASGYAPVTMTLAHALPSVSLEQPMTGTLDSDLRPNTLQGRVRKQYTGRPIAQAQILTQCHPSAQSDRLADTTHVSATWSLSATTDLSGTYTVQTMPATCLLMIRADGYAPDRTRLDQTTTYDTSLRPNVLRGRITDEITGKPVVAAQVQAGDSRARTNQRGQYTLNDVPASARQLQVKASGYLPTSEQFTRTTRLDLTLQPDTTHLALVDAATGSPVVNAALVATTHLTSTGVVVQRLRNQRDGRVTLQPTTLPDHGYLQIVAPGYRKAVIDLTNDVLTETIALQPFYARSIYAKTTTASDPVWLASIFEQIEQTELNALVIDLKSDNIEDLGLVYYPSQAPLVQQLGTFTHTMDIRAILAEASARDISTIARIHVFAHDNLLAETMPQWAIQDAQGCEPNEHRRCNGPIFYADWDSAWLDPWNRNVWQYNIQLAVEAALLGFDEIQFDYIRFPSDASNLEHMRLMQPIDYDNPQPMYDNIVTFMQEAHEAINQAGAFFSVDVFGYAVWQPQPLIGQHAGLMAGHADYIYPMVYPSHFLPHPELGIARPASQPYDIIAESLKRGHEVIGQRYARMRPWLQDFTLRWGAAENQVAYGPAEVRAQIDATEESPYAVGWALWNPDNDYTYEALKSHESHHAP